MATMQFDLELIFPIRDAASAELMTLKAACLSNAGIIDARQRKIVEQRAQRFLGQNALQHSPAFERGMRAVGSIHAARAARNAHRGLIGLTTA
jgi:hypothetical protein